MLGAVLLGGAGRVDLPFVWAYVGVVLAMGIGAVVSVDPGLRRERIRPGPGGMDKFTVRAEQVLLLAHVLVAIADLRFGWWPRVGWVAQATGLFAFAAGGAALVWTMAVNPFFSPLIRLQSERGHRLVEHGPYGWVRHPGYLTASVCILGSGVALGSWWSVTPAVVAVAVFIRRLKLEDAFLCANLEGYDDYAHRVRWKLVRGIW